MNNHEAIKKVVEEVLEEDPKTRDNDTWLIIQVLRKMNFKIYLDYQDINRIPSFETITRCRRKIQNEEGKFLPSGEVMETRKTTGVGGGEGLMANSQLDY